MTFTEFFQSIDWTPLERQAILHFRTKHYLGWGIAKLSGQYEATRRAADAVDYPAFRTDSLETMARWLYGQQAYADGSYDPEKKGIE